MKTIVALALSCLISSPAFADISVRFIEGAPKDRFVVTNTGACDLSATQVKIDLSGTPAGLIFDVTGSGPGVEVFQPFQIVSGQDLVANAPDVSDGDRSVTLDLQSFATGKSVAFTIDVDDTGGAREITISDSEIRGATVGITTKDGAFTAAFAASSEVTVGIPNCAT